MKFECSDCKKTFLYPAKRIDIDPEFTKRIAELKSGQFLSRLSTASGYEPIVETHVCPYCHSLNFQEQIEAVAANKIVSVRSVELEKVDEWIAQGYEVKELYAKSATVIKKEKGENSHAT